MTARTRRVAVLARSVHPFHGYGGLERHVYDLVRHLAARNVAVTLVTRPPAPGQPDARAVFGDACLDCHFVPYWTFPFAGRRGTTVLDRSTAYPLFGLRAGRVVARLVTEGLVDLVHALGASGLGYASARPRAGAPFVFNPQGLEEFGATDPRRARLKQLAYLPLQRAVRTCARAADCVIATDRALAPIVVQHLHVRPARVRVIPNAIDLELLDRQASPADGARLRQRIGLAPDDLLLVSVGRLEASKGFDVLVRALGVLARPDGPLSLARWRSVLLGDGPARPTLERLVREAGLTAMLQLPGAVGEAELHAWYEAATFFVHPTLYEGSSLVTLEAMAHRRAVVASAAGGIPDKVQPGVTGWLVEPGNVDGLAAAIAHALGRRDHLPAMGMAGREVVEREFTWTAATSRLLDLYEELLEATPARGGDRRGG